MFTFGSWHLFHLVIICLKTFFSPGRVHNTHGQKGGEQRDDESPWAVVRGERQRSDRGGIQGSDEKGERGEVRRENPCDNRARQTRGEEGMTTQTGASCQRQPSPTQNRAKGEGKTTRAGSTGPSTGKREPGRGHKGTGGKEREPEQKRGTRQSRTARKRAGKEEGGRGKVKGEGEEEAGERGKKQTGKGQE